MLKSREEDAPKPAGEGGNATVIHLARIRKDVIGTVRREICLPRQCSFLQEGPPAPPSALAKRACRAGGPIGRRRDIHQSQYEEWHSSQASFPNCHGSSRTDPKHSHQRP